VKIKLPVGINLDEVKELQPVPTDQYVCQVKKMEVKAASTGSPMIKWQFMITEGEYKGMAPFFFNTVLLEQSAFSLKDLLTKLDVEWEMEGKVCVFESTDCYKKDIVIIGRLTDYQGKPGNEVDGFLPA